MVIYESIGYENRKGIRGKAVVHGSPDRENIIKKWIPYLDSFLKSALTTYDVLEATNVEYVEIGSTIANETAIVYRILPSGRVRRVLESGDIIGVDLEIALARLRTILVEVTT